MDASDIAILIEVLIMCEYKNMSFSCRSRILLLRISFLFLVTAFLKMPDYATEMAFFSYGFALLHVPSSKCFSTSEAFFFFCRMRSTTSRICILCFCPRCGLTVVSGIVNLCNWRLPIRNDILHRVLDRIFHLKNFYNSVQIWVIRLPYDFVLSLLAVTARNSILSLAMSGYPQFHHIVDLGDPLV